MSMLKFIIRTPRRSFTGTDTNTTVLSREDNETTTPACMPKSRVKLESNADDGTTVTVARSIKCEPRGFSDPIYKEAIVESVYIKSEPIFCNESSDKPNSDKSNLNPNDCGAHRQSSCDNERSKLIRPSKFIIAGSRDSRDTTPVKSVDSYFPLFYSPRSTSRKRKADDNKYTRNKRARCLNSEFSVLCDFEPDRCDSRITQVDIDPLPTIPASTESSNQYTSTGTMEPSADNLSTKASIQISSTIETLITTPRRYVKRRPNNVYTPEQRLEIVEYAIQYGNTAAAKKFTKEFNMPINQSTVYSMKKRYMDHKSTNM